MAISILTNVATAMEENFIYGCKTGHDINGSKFEATDSFTRFSSVYSVPWMNVVLEINTDQPALDARVRTILATMNKPMTWRLGPTTKNTASVAEVLEQQGCVKSEWVEPGLQLQLDKFHCSEPLLELRIEEVRTPQQVEDWLIPFSDGFSVPPDVQGHSRIYGNERRPAHMNEKWFVGYSEERPAACSMYVSACGINMIYSVCTVTQSRNRGYARRMVEHAIKDAASHNDLPICLYSSKQGLSLYKSMGFVEVFKRTDYLSFK